MAKNQKTLRRKRIQRRIRSRIIGTGEVPRFSVFKSSKHVYAQLIDDEKGHTLAAVSTKTKDIQSGFDDKSGIEKAEIVGSEIAAKAKKIGVSKVVFDRGGYKYHGKIKAIADNARKGGLEF